jgi:hypothetical protein
MMIEMMKISDFSIFQKSARQGPGVATTPASATRKISALHPSTKQKFRIKLADESPPLIVGPWHKRLHKDPKICTRL